jgi:hypothetical protein
MERPISFAVAIALLAITVTPAAAGGPTTGDGADAKGKTCRLEQQCRWENFKKICTWVKVCR